MKLATVVNDETTYQWRVSLSLSFIPILNMEAKPYSEKAASTYKSQRRIICIFYGTDFTTIVHVSFESHCSSSINMCNLTEAIRFVKKKLFQKRF